ncbi:unnamed protein product [Anisakis simplex]|uniref:ERAP1_C domain-containing protein n=1 Tax=Anisakis simplex TaxID=6269 RepID=A0A0M3JB40_ANISI|nr:unnamed protein product [Anisakis simplex]
MPSCSCEKYADALVLYMETCVACSDNFTKPFPDNVVDDVMWYKIQRCLRAAGQPTLSALVCQLMRDPQEHYVETTNALLETPHHVLDASTLFFGFISDMNLMEFLNGAYEKMGMPEKAQRLVSGFVCF